MKIYGMMRIKNEARWIQRVLRSMLPVCETVFVFDDHSTDDTREICNSFRQVCMFRSPFAEFEGPQEDRDKNWLLIAVIEKLVAAGDWILSIDGDEEIPPADISKISQAAKSDGPDCYRFQVLYLWNSPDQVRVDGVYKNYRRASMFRLRPGARFHSAAGGGFHCGNVPEPLEVADAGVRLWHWGYLHREDRLRKFAWYTAEDKHPISEREDGYRHIVIGDLFPADSQFRHGGPLELTSLG